MIKKNNGDHVVEEIHKTRREIAEKFGNDIAAIAADARKRQEESGRQAWQSSTLDKSVQNAASSTERTEVEFDVAIRYYSWIQRDSIEEFRSSLLDADLIVHEEGFEPQPVGSLEWIVPTAIAVYLAKPFLDELVKRAAADFGDAVYPKIKRAVTKLVKRCYLGSRQSITTVTAQGPMGKTSECCRFSLCANTKAGNPLKFVFTDVYEEQEYDVCIEMAFDILIKHVATDDDSDPLSEQVKNLPNDRQRRIYLRFDRETKSWDVCDPAKEAYEEWLRSQ